MLTSSTNAVGILLALMLSLVPQATAKPVPVPLYTASPFGSSLMHTGEKARDPHLNNKVLLVENGHDALLLRVHLIRNASRSIDIQTFIWTNDESGRLLMYELIQAARRGVRVRIIADHFVSNKDPVIAAFLATVHPNIQLKHYRPVADRIRPGRLHVIAKTLFRFRHLNQRMHNKVMIFDEALALTGGRNIENTYYNYSLSMNFRDRDVLVLGPIVKHVEESFEKFWGYRHAVPSRKLIDVRAIIDASKVPTFETREDFEFGEIFADIERDANDADVITSTFIDRILPAERVTFLADKPGKNRSTWLNGRGKITKQLGEIAFETERELIIQSPYFVLSKAAIDVFKALRTKSPPVTIKVSSNSFGSTDNTVAYSANYRQRSTTIESLGLHVYEFKPHPADLHTIFPQYNAMLKLANAKHNPTPEDRPPFLCIHAKSFVRDDRFAYIGTYNLDPRSENLNTEVGLLIEDKHIAAVLKAAILRDCGPGNSWVIARKPMPLGLDKLNALFQGISGLSPIDVWPVRNTSSFELISGKTPRPPDHPAFYESYRDVGSFPGAPVGLSRKEIHTRIYKAVGGLATPLL
jgi:putative cardiolipin synthase